MTDRQDLALDRAVEDGIGLLFAADAIKPPSFGHPLRLENIGLCGARPYFFQRMEPALNALLANASSAKLILAGVSAENLLTAVVRLCHGPQGEEPEYARKMVRLLLEGLGCGAGEQKKSSAVRKP